MKNNETLFTDYLKATGKSYADVAKAAAMTTDTDSKEFKSALNMVEACAEYMDKNLKHHELVARAAGMPEADITNYLNDVRMYYVTVEPEKTKDWFENCDAVNKKERAQCEANENLRNTEHDAKWLPKIVAIKGQGTAWAEKYDAEQAAKAEKKSKKKDKAEKKVVVAEPETATQTNVTPEELFGDESTEDIEKFF